jgi:hypothetical protein
MFSSAQIYTKEPNSIFLNRGINCARNTQYGNDRLFTGAEFQNHDTTKTRQTIANINSVLGLKGRQEYIYHSAHTGLIFNGKNTVRSSH